MYYITGNVLNCIEIKTISACPTQYHIL
jgi:hypothetical protein